jgi:hypothetical protein
MGAGAVAAQRHGNGGGSNSMVAAASMVAEAVAYQKLNFGRGGEEIRP